MPQTISWVIAIAAALLLALVTLWLLRMRTPKPTPLPTEWTLSARPVFSTDERRAYRQLREALPHHIVLSKLPLVRFSQPTDPQQVRYWYDLLGATHVTFAICSPNGRVLAAIDLDTDRGNSRRVLQIKQSVLAACRVRYLRCPIDHLPSVPELQRLVPQSTAVARAPHGAPGTGPARDVLGADLVQRRRERAALWRDSGFFQDTFFGAKSRSDTGLSSEYGAIGSILRGGVESRDPTAAPSTKAAGDADDKAAPPRTHH